MTVLEDGALVASDGVIVDVGLTATIAASYDLSRATVLDATDRVVLPGLVDAHTHPLFAGLRYREYAERLAGAEMSEVAARGGGIWWSVQRSREAGEEELRGVLRRHLREMLRAGTTSLEVKSGYGQTTEQELRHLRLIAEAAAETPQEIVPTFLGAHIVPREFASAEAYVDVIVDEMLPEVAAQGVARFCDVSCEANAFTRAQSTRMLQVAASLGMGGRVHADTFVSFGGWTTAVENGAAGADHLSNTPQAEIERVGATDTVATLIPAAELYYFIDRRAPARTFIESGVPVAIATDFCSSIHAPSLYHCLSLAAAWYRMTPEEVINAVTINAAYSLGIDDRAGSLDPDKRADFLLVDVPDYRAIVYEFGVPAIETVVVAGEVVAL